MKLILRVLLFPFAVIYDLVTRLRNHLYSIGQKPSFRFEVMVISVGNLSVGGSGKTPMVEYLIRLLAANHGVSTLSRGYGRRTRGIRFANASDDATTIGDEPFQLARKFGDAVNVVVGEDRAQAIPEILHRFSDTDIIILDDAFQHRRVDPQLSVLLTDYAAPFYKDFILPSGRLREARVGAERAQMVVVTKCPDDLSENTIAAITSSVKKYAGDKPVFFAGMKYDDPVPFAGSELISKNIILVSGIANAKTFEHYAKTQFNVIRHFEFGDHHAFTNDDLKKVIDFYDAQGKSASLLTTEKDMVRLIGKTTREMISTLPWFYIPVRTYFLKNGSDFDILVISTIANFKRTV